MSVNITKLQNGLTVIVDEIKEFKSVSIFLCIKTGSRNESDANNGISHFLEHMLFKGTEKRTAFQIAREADFIGANINAFTSKENTCYYIKCLDKYFTKGIDILSDIYQNSIFDKKELDTERGVILQEIDSSLDSSEDVASDFFMEKYFQNHSLGRTILGPKENIKKFEKEDFISYMNDFYSTENAVLSICGNVSNDMALQIVNEFFTKKPSVYKKEIAQDVLIENKFYCKVKKDLEQMQFLTGYKAPNYTQIEDVYTMQVANNILGDGMSSRLFQEIREKRGLVYTVSSFFYSFADNGIFGVYAGASIDKLHELRSTIQDELEKSTQNITDEEIEKCKNQFISGLAMSDESTSSRARRNSGSFFKYGRIISNEEIMERIEKISKEQVMNFIKDIISKPNLTTVYGNKEVEG